MSIFLLALYLFLAGTSLISTAPLLFLRQPETVMVLLMAAGLLFPLRGVICLVLSWRRSGRPHRIDVFLCLAELLVGALFLCLPRFSQTAFFVALILYLSFWIAVKAIDTRIYARTRQWRYFVPSLVTAVCSADLFLFLLFSPVQLRKQTVAMVVAVLLVLFGLGLLCDFLGIAVKAPRFRRVVGSIRLALPDFIGLLLPLHAVTAMRPEPLLEKRDENEVEVLFQVAERGIALAGHCELCIDGETLTYGCYEPQSRHLFRTVGGGVIIRAPREQYLRWCIRENGKKVISYTLRFPSEQMTLIRSQISDLERRMEPWQPEVQAEEYASRIRAVDNVRFFRVTEGSFRTYFVPTINCVTITNRILEKTELGKAVMLGIKTPGAYLDFLERQYRSGSGIVMNRCVYDRDTAQES